MIIDDPDTPAGTWVHWVIFNLPADTDRLEEGVENVSGGPKHGRNSWARNDYSGPCPPGGRHCYFFKLYALDVEAGINKKKLLNNMEGYVLDRCELVGVYCGASK